MVARWILSPVRLPVPPLSRDCVEKGSLHVIASMLIYFNIAGVVKYNASHAGY